MQKIQDGRHLVQNIVSLPDMLKEKLLLYIQANCMPNFPENKQMNNFIPRFFNTTSFKKMGKKFFFEIFFFRGRVWGL